MHNAFIYLLNGFQDGFFPAQGVNERAVKQQNYQAFCPADIPVQDEQGWQQNKPQSQGQVAPGQSIAQGNPVAGNRQERDNEQQNDKRCAYEVPHGNLGLVLQAGIDRNRNFADGGKETQNKKSHGKPALIKALGYPVYRVYENACKKPDYSGGQQKKQAVRENGHLFLFILPLHYSIEFAKP
jgi:hypothetical protein